MPRKNTKKLRKDQRRQDIDRMRQEKGWQPPPAPGDDDFVSAVLPLSPDSMGSTPLSFEEGEELAELIVESDDLAVEPEFEEFYFHPLRSVQLYGAVEEDYQVTPEQLDELSEQEEDDLFWDIMEEVARRLLTRDERQRVMASLEQVEQRARQSGDKAQAGRVDSLLALLRGPDGRDAWPVLGLVQAILHRTLSAGFDMAEMMERLYSQADSTGEEGQPLPLPDVLPELLESQIQAEMTELLKKYPGLQEHLLDADQQVWEQGLQDLSSGAFYISLFSDEELDRGEELAESALHARGIDPESEEEPDQVLQVLFETITPYVASLVTPDRLETISEEVRLLTEEPDLEAEWSPFIWLLIQELEREDAAAAALEFLVPAFIGEMWGRMDETEESDSS